MFIDFNRILEPVDTAAALGSGRAPLPFLPQPRPRAAQFILGSGPSRFEAIHQPSNDRPKAEDLRRNPLTGMNRADSFEEGRPPELTPRLNSR